MNDDSQQLQPIEPKPGDELSSLLFEGIRSYNASVAAQTAKDQRDFDFRMKHMEQNERQLEKVLSHDWKKFIHIFWLCVGAIFSIFGLAAGLIFVAKDADKGVWLITSTIIGILALLAGRGLANKITKPHQP